MSGDIASLYGGQAVDTSRTDVPTGDFEPMPPGWYPVEIEKVEIRETKDKKGKYLWLGMSVLGDRYANRKLFPKINLVNANAKAVEIGQRELAGLAQACGLMALSDTSELIGKMVDARVKIRKASGDYDADNEVGAYAKVGTKSQEDPTAKAPAAKGKPAEKAKAWDKPAAPAPAPGATQQAPPPAAAAPAKRPWEK